MCVCVCAREREREKEESEQRENVRESPVLMARILLSFL